MSERTGLDAVTLAVLKSLEELGLTPDVDHRKSARVVDHVYAKHGVPPRIGYDVLCTIAVPWLMNVPLVDYNGNLGSIYENEEPAARNYTEVRLSPLGALAVQSERGDLPRLPIELINGDLAFHGRVPPFDPRRVVAALELAAVGASDEDLAERIGPPRFPNGCAVSGELTALAKGDVASVTLSSEIAIETRDGRNLLVISRLPFGVGPDRVCELIATRIQLSLQLKGDPRLRDLCRDLPSSVDLHLTDVRDETDRESGTRIVCELRVGEDPEACRKRLLDASSITSEFRFQLPAPVATLLRGFVDEPARQREVLNAFVSTLA